MCPSPVRELMTEQFEHKRPAWRPRPHLHDDGTRLFWRQQSLALRVARIPRQVSHDADPAAGAQPSARTAPRRAAGGHPISRSGTSPGAHTVAALRAGPRHACSPALGSVPVVTGRASSRGHRLDGAATCRLGTDRAARASSRRRAARPDRDAGRDGRHGGRSVAPDRPTRPTRGRPRHSHVLSCSAGALQLPRYRPPPTPLTACRAHATLERCMPGTLCVVLSNSFDATQ